MNIRNPSQSLEKSYYLKLTDGFSFNLEASPAPFNPQLSALDNINLDLS